jgi:hypothetical protein
LKWTSTGFYGTRYFITGYLPVSKSMVEPKKLTRICCPKLRKTKADTLKATEANRKRGPGTREKVRSKRINLEGNTHAQEINVSQLPV